MAKERLRILTETDKTSIDADINKKVDKVSGKQLSTNDFTNAHKTKLDTTLPAEISKKVDKVTGKQLSTNDFTDANKKALETDIPARIDGLDSELDRVKQSVSDGKQKVSVAITDKGVETAPNATFDTMATNISNIVTDPSIGTTDAVAEDILSGKKVVSQGELITGTMQNNGLLNKVITTQGGTQKISPGYYEGGEVKAQLNNLVPENILHNINIGGVTGNFTLFDTKTKEYEGTVTQRGDLNAFSDDKNSVFFAKVENLKTGQAWRDIPETLQVTDMYSPSVATIGVETKSNWGGGDGSSFEYTCHLELYEVESNKVVAEYTVNGAYPQYRGVDFYIKAFKPTQLDKNKKYKIRIKSSGKTSGIDVNIYLLNTINQDVFNNKYKISK